MLTHAEKDDATLARLAKSGELRAFDELARRYQSPLIRFIHRRVRGSDAEDVAQETFVKAYRSLHQYRPGRAFKSWLFAIAYHEMIDRHRRRDLKYEPADEFIIRDDPSSEADRADRKTSLWSIAKRVLNDEQFTAVWLFYAEQLPAGEVATIMGRSWVSVKVLLHRARGVLARHLKEASFLDPSSASSQGSAVAKVSQR